METTKITKQPIPIEHHVLLAKLYQEAGVPLDRLAYTPEFDDLHVRFCALSRIGATRKCVWDQLVTLRKSNHLTKIGRKKNR